MDEKNLAITAGYFELGLKAGVLDEDRARSWALSIVEASDTPPLDLLEVLASRNFGQLIETLREVRGQEDMQLAGRWLLHTLHRQLIADHSMARTVVRQACHVAQSAGLPEQVWNGFSGIDDGFFLADSGTYGTSESCFAELTEALAQVELMPEPSLSDEPASRPVP